MNFISFIAWVFTAVLFFASGYTCGMWRMQSLQKTSKVRKQKPVESKEVGSDNEAVEDWEERLDRQGVTVGGGYPSGPLPPEVIRPVTYRRPGPCGVEGCRIQSRHSHAEDLARRWREK